jgi:hypothetical protein
MSRRSKGQESPPPTARLVLLPVARSATYDALWRWLLAPVPDGATTEGESQVHEQSRRDHLPAGGPDVEQAA